jgi:ankyrin repeat protein
VGRDPVVKLLLRKRVDVDPIDSGGLTPLLRATRRGHKGVAGLLLSTDGVSRGSKNAYNGMKLLWMVESGDEAAVKLLLDRGTDIEFRDIGNSRQTPLLLAAERGRDDVVKLLLERGANADAKDRLGRTPLTYAAMKGNYTIVKLLLDKGAHPNATTTCESEYNTSRTLWSTSERGETPLLCAARYGHECVVKLLLDRGANFESEDEFGCTPLSGAIANGHEAIVQLFLDKGAKCDAKDITSRSHYFLSPRGVVEPMFSCHST